MDDDGLPIIGPGVDYTKVPPIQQKRTLAFLNYFLTRTTSFLNHFATVCDEKLEDLLIRIQRLEASMCILEAKGIPLGAVQIKMRQENVDPSILDNPDAPAPPGARTSPCPADGNTTDDSSLSD
ncbi:hypothetical protein HPB50_000504 [Hyalomma asiaticum]|uniref:Uncharacterized protein n=1 Tax=Hyalomma asiaticum TaxID=266040 RepID=A0ACB7RR54_HYAAI|nr:hypothetical protein HPB50_000504 [Hyalomma asiaticum]